MRCGQLSPGARLLIWEISQWTADDSDVCVRSQNLLAQALGTHRNSVIRWVQELEEAGVLTSEPTAGRVNAYTLNLRAVEALGTKRPEGAVSR